MSVDVVITSCPSPERLKQSLKWLVHQTFSDWRAVVVTTLPHAEVKKLAAQAGVEAGRLLVLDVPNRGEASERNIGLEHTDADHVLFLRAGDRLLKRSLGRLVVACERGGLGGAVGACSAPGIDPAAPAGTQEGASIEVPDTTVGLHDLLDGFCPASGAVLTRRDAIGSKRFGVNLTRHNDIDLWLRLAEEGVRWRSAECVVTYFQPDEPAPMHEHIASASEIVGILGRSFRRASARGWDEAELGEEREAIACAVRVLRIATQAALTEEDPRRTASTELFREFAIEGIVTPDIAATSAAHAILSQEGFRACVGRGAEEQWARPIHAWWSRCVSEKWASGVLSNRAIRSLAERLVSPEEVAQSLLDQLGMPGQIYVTGADRTALAVADAATAKGWQVGLVSLGAKASGRSPDRSSDRASDRAWADAVVGASGERYTSVSPEVVTDEQDPLVIGGAMEEVAIGLFQGRPNVMRYMRGHHELADKAIHRLRAVWPKRGESAETALGHDAY